ncbi:hypothetical protein HPB51_019688 [Rhipicephalus microplus]|uniref:Condensin complex subunit 1 n=1 Tax=Rhipicephalus microplus TaxID=6941 RepID=A0A9J6F5K4_RHIMP|nr:hypothetical protein HPB51_019688 [Rhipicephalus microplus]
MLAPLEWFAVAIRYVSGHLNDLSIRHFSGYCHILLMRRVLQKSHVIFGGTDLLTKFLAVCEVICLCRRCSWQTDNTLLFSCIDKERQLENFIEKLCFRFMIKSTERHWRDLAFCLSLIPFGERGIKKLHENVVCFADKMHVDAVYESITGIIANAKKAQVMKPDVKVILQELEDLVEELRNKNLTESELVQRTKRGIAQASATKRGNKPSCATPKSQKTPAKGRRRCQRKLARISESSDEDEEDQESPPPSPRKARPQRQCKVRIQLSDSSEEEVDDSDDE